VTYRDKKFTTAGKCRGKYSGLQE